MLITSSASPMFLAHSSSAFLNSASSFRLNKPQKWTLKPLIITAKIPNTDRVIDFGKHKGKMIGTLPSNYLKWVSKNLRAGDFEHWAKLADQVLQDPVYQDRLEWEYAQRVLDGNDNRNTGDDGGSVSQLLEISERFGWDNEDKVGWSKLKFDLLGTSKGGRIPRKATPSASSSSTGAGGAVKEEKQRLGVSKAKRSDGILSESEERRRERRERVKLKRSQGDRRREKLGITGKSRGSFVNGVVDGDDSSRSKKQESDEEDETEEVNRLFPGREALLKKVISSRRRFL